MTPVRVIVVDDHARTRAALREALERWGEFVVSAEAADAEGAIEAVSRVTPDVCLLDINMPGSGIAAAGRISALVPNTSVVMLTVSRDDDDLFDALRAGAMGYLLKGTDERALVEALHRVLNGEASLPGSLVARLVEEFRDREQRRVALPSGEIARLTGREWDVLELMRKGATTAQIAKRLFVSKTTVRSHISAAIRKLGVGSRDAAIAMFESSADKAT